MTSLPLYHSDHSPLTPRSPRSHSQYLRTWPTFLLRPTDRSKQVMSSGWAPGGWHDTIRLPHLSCSANHSERPVWSRSFDKSSARVECSLSNSQAPSLPLFREQEGQPQPLPVPFFSIPGELHILLPVPSVECYSLADIRQSWIFVTI